jgi:thioredoxin-related protein
MARLILVAVVVVVAVIVAVLAQRRRPDAPTNPRHSDAPTQLDRSDFDRPEAPWLVAVFSSATCSSCAQVRATALALDSEQVAVVDVEVGAEPGLHRRYHVDAVPTTVLVDDTGAVRRSFVGPVSATHLWGAMAELRAPGTVPDGCSAGPDDPGS